VEFARDKFPYAELQEHVPRVFQLLRRWYFNRYRRQFKERLARMNSRQELAELAVHWALHGYGSTVLNLVGERLRALP